MLGIDENKIEPAVAEYLGFSGVLAVIRWLLDGFRVHAIYMDQDLEPYGMWRDGEV